MPGWLLLLAALALSGPVSVGAAIDVTSVGDLCALDADPCVISEVLRTPASVTLDLGLRALHLEEGARLET